ncbi:MAG: hypothetical protein ACKVP0_05130 [Pirellulaceae bacterium]
MNIGHTPKTGSSPETCLLDKHSEAHALERYALAYARFDALMTAQLLELEFRFRDFWSPQTKKRELLGRR